MSEFALSSCDVLDVRCVAGDVLVLSDAVIERALSGEGGYGVFCNVHVLMTARRRPEVMRAVGNAWAVFPDGAPIAWFQRRVGMRAAERVGGPDLMRIVLDRGRDHGLRHALFGSTPEVVSALAGRLRETLKGVDIVAAHAPTPGDEDKESLHASLSAARPHVIWCALGAPKQELWMARHTSALAPAVVLGVGAAFDFHAGTKDRAPEWMRRAGLEWLHRLGREPRRLAVRYLTTNAAFVAVAAAQLTRRRIA